MSKNSTDRHETRFTSHKRPRHSCAGPGISTEHSNMHLTGLHHVTAISANPTGNHAFYAGLLGLRLVEKTVNQDDVAAYHLFYADALVSPGTDLTSFDFPLGPERHGTGSVVRTALRVSGPGAFDYWVERLSAAGIVTSAPHELSGFRQLDFGLGRTTFGSRG